MSSHGTTSEPPTPPTTERGTGWLALSLVLLAALGAHLWLLGARWINPDEGAHLMDGVLLLDGLFPGVDYGARQPFYVFATAAVLEIFGVGFVPGRLLALICTLGGAAVLYAIARELFDARVALLSTAFFLFLPFPLMLSVNAKTEPLAILLATGAMWMVIRALRGRARPLAHFGAAGALAALGYYVRESGLAILAALVLILAWSLRRSPRRLAGAGGSVAAGFVAVAVVIGGVHASQSSVAAALASASINPLVFVYRNVVPVADALLERVGGVGYSVAEAAEDEVPPAEPAAALEQPQEGRERVRPPQGVDVRLRLIVESLRFNAVLVVGTLLFPLVVIVGRRRRRPGELEQPGFAALTLLAWAGSMSAAYLLWAVRRGFFQAYFLEIMPPLTILAAAAVVHSGRELVEGTGWLRVALAGAVLAAALLVAPAVVGGLPLDRPLYFVAPVAVLAVVHFLDRAEQGRWLAALAGIGGLTAAVLVARTWLPGPAHAVLYAILLAAVFLLVFRAARIPWSAPYRLASFASYALIVSAFFLTLGESLPRANLRYDGVWGPSTVRTVADEVRSLTGPDDVVLSGAVVWELQAGRRPFMNMSHPLGLIGDYVEEAAPPIRRALAEGLPPVVVVDGYTEWTYLAAVPELRDILETRYTRTLIVETDARYPVEVYRLTEGSITSR